MISNLNLEILSIRYFISYISDIIYKISSCIIRSKMACCKFYYLSYQISYIKYVICYIQYLVCYLRYLHEHKRYLTIEHIRYLN